MSDEQVERRRPRPDLDATVRSRIDCTCGFVATGRTPDATGDGYRDHIAFAHGQTMTVEGFADLRKAIA